MGEEALFDDAGNPLTTSFMDYQIASIDHEVYGSFAEMDNGIPPETVNEFVSALRAAGVDNDVHIYDHVSHGFWLHVDRDADKNTPAAVDAWKRLRAYLQRTLG